MTSLRVETLRVSALTREERESRGMAPPRTPASTNRQGAQARSLNARRKKVSLAPVSALRDGDVSDE